MKERLISVFTIGALLLTVIIMFVRISGIDDKKPELTTTAPTTFAAEVQTTVPAVSTTLPVITTTVPSTVPAASVTEATTVPTTAVTDSSPEVTQGTTAPVSTTAPAAENLKPETTKEIIDKYTQLVNDFKANKPAYKKKEFQALPEEFRNFGTGVNVILNIASGYMVSEEECEELIRPAGSEDILWDMPVHNTEKGCILTDYDAVTWAKCEDMGDGTYKISFSLKEEVNPQPTPAETLIPVSAHGAVMQPIALDEIMTEVDKITGSLPGIAVNDFALYHRDCEFICIYNPETDQVLSITHHIVIDITADIKLFTAQINGSARLLNEMLIYDITW